jgi:hypothetical protein
VTVDDEARRAIDALPPALRALLDAELAAGNAIVEVGHSFPAPPAGAYVRLARSVSTRPRASGGGIEFYDRDSSSYSGEFTDARRFYFLLEPPHPPPPEADMDAIRAAAQSPRPAGVLARGGPAPQVGESPPSSAVATPLQRFERSMIIDYEKWHDGIGYDLDALRAAAPAERAAIERLLIDGGVDDWRDVEALAALATPRARAALQAALTSADHALRAAVVRCAPEMVPDVMRTQLLVEALQSADLYGGLSEALDQVEVFHPPAVIDALLRAALARDGEAAVNCAAMVMFVHGRGAEPFDWAQRPFFLRFHSTDRAEREAVFRELCAKIGVDPTTYL